MMDLQDSMKFDEDIAWRDRLASLAMSIVYAAYTCVAGRQTACAEAGPFKSKFLHMPICACIDSCSPEDCSTSQEQSWLAGHPKREEK